MMRWLVLAGCAGLCGAAWAVQAPAPFTPGKVSKEEQAALQPGLTLRFLKGASEPVDARRVRLPALHVPAGSAPSPFLPAGPFTAHMVGYIKSPLRAETAFRLVTTGSATLRINDKEVLKATPDPGQADSEPVNLAKGYNRIDVHFSSAVQGASTLRLYWSGESFGWEPIPPEVLFTRGDTADLTAGTQVREGRYLYATLGCSRCHDIPAGAKGTTAMPEMQHQAPSLAQAGARFRPAWLAQWIADPRALRPEATMPRALHGDSAAVQAADIAAYLGTLKSRDKQLTPTVGADGAAGEKHFNKLGCVTCHHLKEPAQEDELKRLSLYHVRAKFQDGALEAFLRLPHQHYPWIRMPDFKLNAKEAAEIAVYLNREANG